MVGRVFPLLVGCDKSHLTFVLVFGSVLSVGATDERKQQQERKVMASKKSLDSLSTGELLRLWKESDDPKVSAEAHRLVQARKGKNYPVALGSLFSGRF